MGKPPLAKIKFFGKSGARVYIPESIRRSSEFPFSDGEIVKVVIGNPNPHNPSVSLVKVEWWEMLDWSTMQKTFEKLPPDIKQKITNAGLM